MNVLVPHDLSGSRPDFRAVRRAAAELRHGTPIIVEAATADMVALAVETAGKAGLAEFAAAADGQAMLLLDSGRAARWTPGFAPAEATVAVAMEPGMLQPSILLGIADPTARQLLAALPPTMPPPDGAETAVRVAKLARLLPAVLLAKLAEDRSPAADDLLRVRAADVAAQPTAAVDLIRVAEAAVPLQDAPECRIVAFRSADSEPEHLAVLVGAPDIPAAGAPAPLVRIHSECLTGDLLGSLRCDCGPQLRGAIRRMAAEGSGVLLYLAQEGRGIGLPNKLRAYALQDAGMDTLDANRALGWGADERSFAAAAGMLRSLDIDRVRLLTNNPKKLAALMQAGIAVERVSHLFAANGVNDAYLATKADRFGHLGT